MSYFNLILFIFFLTFLVVGYYFPLRISKDYFPVRLLQNLSFSIMGLALSKALVFYLYPQVSVHGFKSKFEIPFLILLMLFDYGIYWWHRLNHRLRFLWRFHLVHHTDHDMDTTTALRFHYGELFFSILLKSSLVFLAGIPVSFIFLFDFLVTSFSLFHHSNIRLPEKAEKYLRRIIVTPTFHQNHHSFYQNETDSNFGTIFSFWDRLHGTHTKEMPVSIGVPAYHEKFSFFDLIFLPAKKLRSWPVDLKTRTKST